MPGCCNCNSSDIQYRLCKNCYINIFRTLSCDGCGTKCDPSKRSGPKNVLLSPFWCFCDTCKKNVEDPNKKIQSLKEKEKELYEVKSKFQINYFLSFLFFLLHLILYLIQKLMI